MTRRTKWLAGIIGALAIVGGMLVWGLGDAVLAQSRTPSWAPAWMAGHMTGEMAGHMTGDMATMHQAMSGLMAEMPALHNQMLAAVGAQLGLSPEELEQRLANGETLAALAGERGIAADAVKGALIGFMEQKLTELAQSGKLDAQVAAQMRGLIPQHAETCLTMNVADMQGMMGMMGMMGTRSGPVNR